MRQAICSMSLLLSSAVLTACGQSGTLQLPSDPAHDKRAKYLLYKNEAASTSSSLSQDEASTKQSTLTTTP